MWNCRWLLCLIVIGLATRGASSMNEQPPNEKDSPKTVESNVSLSLKTNSDEDRKPNDEHTARDRHQVPFASSPTVATAADVTANITSSNGTVVLVTNAGATSINGAKLGSHEQSHSKRHFRRSKLYRKESRTKSRTSLTRSNVASGNLIPFSTEHVRVPSHDLFHNPEHNSDSIKLMESTPKTSSTRPAKTHSATTSHDDSISTTSSRSLDVNGSKDTSHRKFDALSSIMTTSSGSTENSSLSSDARYAVDEKSSSIELIAFTFDSLDKVRQSTLPNEVETRMENFTASPSIAPDSSSARTIVMVQTSENSVDKSKSASADLTYSGVDRGQSLQSAKSDFDDDVIIYSVHTEKSLDVYRVANEMSTSVQTHDNMTKDDSVILVSVPSESSVSKNLRNTSSNGRRSGNESSVANSVNNLNHNRLDPGGYSRLSVDDSLNRLSLTRVVDTLKNVDFEGTRSFHSDTNSTPSKNSDASSVSKRQIIDASPVSVKHSQFLTVPEVFRSSRELRPSINSVPEVKVSDQSDSLPVSLSTTDREKLEHPLRLIVPLDIDAIVKTRTKNNSVVKDSGLPRPSTSADLLSKKRSLERSSGGSRDKPFRSALGPEPSSSRCASDSLIERSEQVGRIYDENLFYQRRSGDVTLSISGNSISEPEQCLTRRSSAQTPLHPTHEPERPIEDIDSPVLPSNPEEKEVGISIPAEKSHERKDEAIKSGFFSVDDNRGPQSVLSSSIIILENFEPVVLESLTRDEAAIQVETGTPTASHFFSAMADIEEHCNASNSFDVFIPSVNSRETIAKLVVPDNEPQLVRRDVQNLTTTEDSLYIMEGFGFFKSNADEVSELEEEFDRRREVSFDYSEIENYPGYPQLDDHPAPVKLIDQIEIEAELPVKQEPRIGFDSHWKGNTDEQDDDPWWLDNEFKQLVNNDDHTEQKSVLVLSEKSMSKEVRPIPSLPGDVLGQINESKDRNYRIYLLPTIYVLIGICVVVVGCSIWCSKVPDKRQRNLPKLTCFIQQGTTEAVV